MNKTLSKIFISLSLILGAFSFTACKVDPKKDQETTHIDYASLDTARLAIDYKNRSFLTDGIAKVNLQTAIDGDTAHFKEDGNEDLIKCRFYGIDTPESTGKIQPYGQAASNYTKAKLKEANSKGTIVISVPQDEYCAPSFDSTGTRYLALIWINETEKDADYKSLKLLNLMLVQEGYSEVKNADEMPRLQDIFWDALAQAKEEKLNLFSGQDDPLFNYGDYEPIDILDYKKEWVKQLEAEANGETYVSSYAGMNVKIVGTVVGLANGILYLQNYYSKENGGRYDYGEYAAINVYTGMGSVPSKYTKPNTYLKLCGNVSNSENFGLQVSGCEWAPYSDREDNAEVLISANNNVDEYKLKTFDVSLSDLKQGDYELLNQYVAIEEKVVVTGGYTSAKDSITLYVRTLDGTKSDMNVYVSFYYQPGDNATIKYETHEAFVGKTFSLSGILASHKNSSGKSYLQILPRGSSDMVLISE